VLEQLKEQIRIVVDARRRAQVASDAKAAARIEWETQNRGLLDEAIATAEQVTDAESRLRELTLQVYSETGDKAPMVGVGIREMTRLEYDKTAAFNWAVEHVMALKLDTSAFEKIAKASPLAFVKVSQEAQATIATQLEIVE